jgi:hypothetical protein
MALALHLFGTVMWRVYILLAMAISVPAFTLDLEIVPCKTTQFANETPTCCLKKTETEFVIYQGEQVLKTLPFTDGVNIVTVNPRYDGVLKLALDTLISLRQAGACR